MEPFWAGDGAGAEELIDPGEASAWDTAELGGQRLPGLVRVEGDIARKINVSSGPGLDGATLTPLGTEPASLTISVLLWTPKQWDRWKAIAPIVTPQRSKRPPQPLALSHPAASLLGVTAVLVEKVSAPKAGSVRGSVEVTITVKQWLKPRPALVGVPTLNVPTVASVEPTRAPAAPSTSGKADP